MGYGRCSVRVLLLPSNLHWQGRKQWREGLGKQSCKRSHGKLSGARGNHLYIDNFYTSPQLFEDHLEAGTLACGTIRSNRKGFPAVVKDNVDQNDSLFCKVDMTEGFITAVHWKDKRDIFALTTIHGNAVGDDIPHKPETDL